MGNDRPLQPAPMPDADAPEGALVVSGRVVAPAGVLAFSYSSASGPGGQNVNKRATKCTLRVRLRDLSLSHAQLARLEGLASRYRTDEGELVISADEHRSQPRNREEALERLRDLVRRCLVAPKIRRPTKPTKGSQRRRLDEKRGRSEVKKGRGERHEG